MNEWTTKQVFKRIILWLLLAMVIFAIGIVIGYVVVGHGKWTDLIHLSTWQHMFQLLNG